MKLWGRHTSINVQKVLWTCAELNLATERVDVGGDFGGLDSPALGRLNPNRRIPVLEDGAFVIWEANTIVRYLAREHGHGDLYPTSSRALADAERWMDWQLCHVLPPMRTLFVGLIKTPPHARNQRAIDEAKVDCEHTWALLDAQLADRRFVIGDGLTISDLALGPFAHRWLSLPMERPELPHVGAWYRRLTERESYRRHVMLPLA